MFRLNVFLCVVFSVTGCQDNGIDLEFHLPKEPNRNVQLEITIDKKAGSSPRQVSHDVYAIDFSKDGRATINSNTILHRWQVKHLITPTQRLREFSDFTTNGGYDVRMTKKRETLPNGDVRWTSKVNGSKYILDIEILRGPSASSPAVKAEAVEDSDETGNAG